MKLASCALIGVLAISLAACTVPRTDAEPPASTAANTDVVSDEFDGPADDLDKIMYGFSLLEILNTLVTPRSESSAAVAAGLPGL